MLEGLGILGHFAAVYGGNSFERKKPDPVGIFQILSDTKGQLETTWMIGDSAVDVLTGRNAGVKTCGVSWGYATDSFKKTPPDFLIHRFEELEGLCEVKGNLKLDESGNKSEIVRRIAHPQEGWTRHQAKFAQLLYWSRTGWCLGREICLST